MSHQHRFEDGVCLDCSYLGLCDICSEPVHDDDSEQRWRYELSGTCWLCRKEHLRKLIRRIAETYPVRCEYCGKIVPDGVPLCDPYCEE